MEALRKNLDTGNYKGPYHIYIEMKSIKDPKNFPLKFDHVIQSVFPNTAGSKFYVFTQQDYETQGYKFPEPKAMENKIMFQISGSAGETTLLKPLCTFLTKISPKLCPLFSAKLFYDLWPNPTKLAFPDITGYNFRRYPHRAFINFPAFMLVDITQEEILMQQRHGKVIRTFLVDDKFMKSTEGHVPNLLTRQIDPLNPAPEPFPYWTKKKGFE